MRTIDSAPANGIVRVAPSGRRNRAFLRDYTTTEVARLLGCSPRTVATWMTRGLFPGAYRLPTSDGQGGSGCDRRIPLRAILDFCRASQVPIPDALLGEVLIVGPAEWASALSSLLDEIDMAARHAPNPFTAGFACALTPPRTIVVQVGWLGLATTTQLLRSAQSVHPCYTVAVFPEDQQPSGLDGLVTTALSYEVSVQIVAREVVRLVRGR
jgi:hypothetical protein